jgi:hypothetical protein
MKIVFESESEIGPCDPDRIDAEFGEHPGNWMIVGQTTAALTSPKGMLRIEQTCYLRSAESPEDVRPQSWLRAEITFEPNLGSVEESHELLVGLHERYIQQTRRELMDRSLLLLPGVFSVV